MTSEDTRSCAISPVEYPDGLRLGQIAYGEELRFADTDHDPPGPSPAARLRWQRDCERRRCRDCGVAGGGTHHPGCDMEECPRCRHQLIACGCLDTEEELADDSQLLN